MPPSIADASEGDLSTKDLLIRSITTILWLLWPKAKNSHSHTRHHLQRLSRLSLLFVSATQAADVAAITAIVDRSYVHVEAIQGKEEALDGRLEVVKNHSELYARLKLRFSKAVLDSSASLALSGTLQSYQGRTP